MLIFLCILVVQGRSKTASLAYLSTSSMEGGRIAALVRLLLLLHLFLLNLLPLLLLLLLLLLPLPLLLLLLLSLPLPPTLTLTPTPTPTPVVHLQPNRPLPMLVAAEICGIFASDN